MNPEEQPPAGDAPTQPDAPQQPEAPKQEEQKPPVNQPPPQTSAPKPGGSSPLAGIDIKSEFKKAIEIVKLNVPVMQTVSKQANATKVAVGIIILGGVASFIGMYLQLGRFASATGFFGISLSILIQSAIFGVLMTVAFIWLLSFIAVKQGGKVTFIELLRTLGYGAIVSWASIIPFLGIVAIWNVVIAYKALLGLAGMKGEKAILTIVIAAVILIVVGWLAQSLSFGVPFMM